MDQNLLNQIESAIAETEEARKSPQSYSMLPEIIESLKVMRQGDLMTVRERERLAGSLGRLVTESFTFSESPMGTMLLQLAEQFAPFEK